MSEPTTKEIESHIPEHGVIYHGHGTQIVCEITSDFAHVHGSASIELADPKATAYADCIRQLKALHQAHKIKPKK